MFSMFGRENVTVHEFSNPSNYHFRSFNLANATCVADNDDTWHGGDTWYTGSRWRTCHCPICGQALGWQWSKNDKIKSDEYDWVGLRIDSVSNWKDYFLGPISNLPELLNSFGR